VVPARFRASATAFRSTTITDDVHLLPKLANFIIQKANLYAKFSYKSTKRKHDIEKDHRTFISTFISTFIIFGL